MANRAGGKLMWFSAGLAVGFTAALLYTPASGPEMRRKIVQKTAQGRIALMERSEDLIDRGRRMVEKGRRIAGEAAELFERGRKLVEGIAASDLITGNSHG